MNFMFVLWLHHRSIKIDISKIFLEILMNIPNIRGNKESQAGYIREKNNLVWYIRKRTISGVNRSRSSVQLFYYLPLAWSGQVTLLLWVSVASLVKWGTVHTGLVKASPGGVVMQKLTVTYKAVQMLGFFIFFLLVFFFSFFPYFYISLWLFSYFFVWLCLKKKCIHGLDLPY